LSAHLTGHGLIGLNFGRRVVRNVYDDVSSATAGFHAKVAAGHPLERKDRFGSSFAMTFKRPSAETTDFSERTTPPLAK
jgi:hypothetical protein